MKLNGMNHTRNCVLSLASMIIVSFSYQMAHADAIPYPNNGTYNATTYTFTASATGPVTGYFISGGAAAYSNTVGLYDVTTNTYSAYGLPNHSSSYGDSFNFGSVNVGDTLVLNNAGLGGALAYSDPSMNLAYQYEALPYQNHVYSTTFSGDVTVPTGTYVAFEDGQFPWADMNYNDESFVFTNVGVTPSSVPEPATLVLFGLGIFGSGLMKKRLGK